MSYGVYTGLRIQGSSAGTLQQQISDAAGYGLTLVTPGGHLYRAGGQRNPVSWQGTFRSYVDQIFENRQDNVQSGSRQTVITALNNTSQIPTFGSYALQAVDTADIAAILGVDLRVGAGILIHELVEQFRKQVHNEAFLFVQGNELGGGAHTHGIQAESAVVGGLRGPVRQALTPAGRRLSVTYAGAGLAVDLAFTITATANLTIANVAVQRR